MSTPKNTQDPLVKVISESITKLAKTNNWKRPTKSPEEQLKEQQLQQKQNSPLNYYWGEQKFKSNSLYEYASQNNPEYTKNEPTKSQVEDPMGGPKSDDLMDPMDDPRFFEPYSGELKYLPSKPNDFANIKNVKINRIKGDWHPNTPNAIINAFNTTDLDREAGEPEFSSQSLERELVKRGKQKFKSKSLYENHPLLPDDLTYRDENCHSSYIGGYKTGAEAQAAFERCKAAKRGNKPKESWDPFDTMRDVDPLGTGLGVLKRLPVDPELFDRLRDRLKPKYRTIDDFVKELGDVNPLGTGLLKRLPVTGELIDRLIKRLPKQQDQNAPTSYPSRYI